MADRKKLLLRKGAEIANQLEERLAGKDVDITQGIPTQLLPEKDPELRRLPRPEASQVIEQAGPAQIGTLSLLIKSSPEGGNKCSRSSVPSF
jgi:hypothetical protein